MIVSPGSIHWKSLRTGMRKLVRKCVSMPEGAWDKGFKENGTLKIIEKYIACVSLRKSA